jgi:hypothetical protein
MALDRELQKSILQVLSDNFPQYTRLRDRYSSTASEQDEIYNLYYLRGHGLVEIKLDDLNRVPPARITSAGLDFLAGDGGLTAILGVVTIKLHDDTIRALLIERVDAAEGEQSVKSEMKAQIRRLPAEMVKSVMMKLVETGLSTGYSSLPKLMELLP